MPKLKANFVADWNAHLRSCLISEQRWSANEVVALQDEYVASYYFDAQRRRIAISPRTIRVADSFSCPLDQEIGWAILQEKIRNGEDINPHLSDRHASLHNRDGLLAEWGVHHFHLGTIPYPKNPIYVDRTGPLLFARVEHKIFYAINVYDHHSFEDLDILESIHRNWPELIKHYQVKAVTKGVWDKKHRRELRRKNGNILTVVSDGTVYMPITGGVMASGINAEALRQADYWYFKIRDFQFDIEKKLDSLLPALIQCGYAGEDEIEAELKLFSETSAQVLFPRYNVIAKVKIVK